MKETSRQEDFLTDQIESKPIASTTSKGNQPKWYLPERGLYLKQNYHGYESLVEWVVSKILIDFSNVPVDLVTEYTLCKINGKPGCYSYSFKNEYEDEVTLADILGSQLPRYYKVLQGKSHKEQYDIIIETVKNFTGLDISKELKLTFAIDAFFLNTDRHLNNLSLLENDKGEYRYTPIFDNGLALLANIREFPIFTSPTSNMAKAKPYLLTSKFKNHAKFYDDEPFLYKDEILKFIQEYESDLGRIYDVIRHQLRNPDLQHFFIM